jgi:hypothetical protein
MALVIDIHLLVLKLCLDLCYYTLSKWTDCGIRSCFVLIVDVLKMYKLFFK